jgi:hypothetical protein
LPRNIPDDSECRESPQIIWQARNQGDEALENDQIFWQTQPSESFERWTSTAFKGTHRMICKIQKDGQILAETSHIVKIAAGRWWKR